MEDNTFLVFSFSSTKYAIASEAAVSKIEARLIPIPPEISAGCGLALRANIDDKEKILKLLQNANIEYEGMYILNIKDKKRTALKV